MRNTTLITACILSLTYARNSFGEEDLFAYGALACVVQLQRDNPSQPKDLHDENISVISRSSGFFVGDSNRNVFLVTAAHNLVDCTDVRAIHPNFGTEANPASIVSERSRPRLKEHFYFDQAEDVAVFQVSDQIAADFWSRSTNENATGKVIGEFWNSDIGEATTAVMPRGGVASSAGTISETIVAKQPAYSCTVSRYLKGKDLGVPLRKNYTSKSTNNDLQRFREAVISRINNQQFLVVESMSITAGFSGSPIMISKNHFLDGRIIGIVLGGTDSYQVGRHVWAAPSDVIKKAVENTAKANKDINNLHWATFRSNRVLQDPEAIGRWMVSTSIGDLNNFLSEEFQSPFAGRYSIESRIEFKGAKPDTVLCADELKARVKELPGRAFRFQNITFSVACLNDVNLLSPYFKNCTFKATRFSGSVITGAVFDSCRFINSQNVQSSIRDILSKPCEYCFPAIIVAPRFIGTYAEPEEEIDDGLRLTKSK